jgi:hypothetical protein
MCLTSIQEISMTRVVVDANLRSQLHDLNQPLEFCDEAGKLLGRFVPEAGGARNEPEPPFLSEEELQRREREADYTTAELLAHLEKL